MRAAALVRPPASASRDVRDTHHLAAAWRRQPGGGPSDFINRLVNARVQGKPMNDQQLIGYLFAYGVWHA